MHGFLQKKREFEPDPVEEVPPAAAEAAGEAADGEPAALRRRTVASLDLTYTMKARAEPPDRGAAMGNVAAAAQFLRKREPFSPAPYLMLRGLRWGELRASSDPGVLEAPPTEIRRQIKALAMNNRWTDLLETAENVMAMPCGRAWLDLQRFVVEACVALGSDYNAIAIAIRSELRTLLRDLPELLDAVLTDETAGGQSGNPNVAARTDRRARRRQPPPQLAPPAGDGWRPGPRLAKEVHRSARPGHRGDAQGAAAKGV